MNKVGDGTRILNFIIDGFLVFMLSFFAFRFWNFYVVNWNFRTINFWWFVAGALFVYYTFWEASFNRTPGKFITATKVVRLDGNKPLLVQILIRSLVRLTLIDFLFMAVLGKPLHDLVSKTTVVEC